MRERKPRAALLSIRPVFAEAILRGTKTVELRRRRPDLRGGETVVIYASGPVSALVGAFVVGDVTEASPATLWRRFGSVSGLNRHSFMAYFKGASSGVGISVLGTWRAPKSIKLKRLQSAWPNFVAPQSYRYVTPALLRQLPRSWIEVARTVSLHSRAA
jgi:predicted transcriptional regulator